MIHLILHYCNHDLPARQAEYDFCFEKNLNHPFVTTVHNLVDPQTVVPERFRSHPKYVEYAQPGKWISYKQVFDHANAHFPGKIVATMNLDTFLDDQGTSWSELPAIAQASIVLCLSRTEYDPGGRPYKDPDFARMAFANSQDAWIFLAPFDVPDCDFHIGTLGCDNAIAERIKRTGRMPVNSPNRFRLLHFDRARNKTSANQHLHHAQQRGDTPNQYPEQVGQYLLPDIDQVKSVDEVLKAVGASELDRYSVICDTISRFIKIKN